MEEAAVKVATMGAALAAMTFPAVAIFKASIQLRGWIVRLFALALCVFLAWCFWSWGSRQEWGLNVIAIILGFGGATGANRGITALTNK